MKSSDIQYFVSTNAMGSDPSFFFKPLALKYKWTALNRAFRPLQVTWSRRALRRLRLEPIHHPQSDPLEMGFDALDSGSGMVDDGFSLIFTSEETEFVIVGVLLGVAC
jgi:hypothetical protein